MDTPPSPETIAADTKTPEVPAAPRGSTGLGIVLGLVVLLGGYYVAGWIVPNSDLFPQFFIWLALPWLALAALAFVFVRSGQRATALGLGLAGLVLASLVILLIGAWAVLFSLSDPAKHH